MQATTFTPFVQQSQEAVQVLLGAQSVYQGMRRFANKVGMAIYMVLVGLPAIGVLWLYLVWVRRKMAAMQDLPTAVDFSNYADLRQQHDELAKNGLKIGQVISAQTHQPWYFRGIVNQVKRIGELNDRHRQAIGQLLQQLDPQPTAADGQMRPLKEAELWQQRAKAYDYLL